jgi:hypothetical protein
LVWFNGSFRNPLVCATFTNPIVANDGNLNFDYGFGVTDGPDSQIVGIAGYGATFVNRYDGFDWKGGKDISFRALSDISRMSPLYEVELCLLVRGARGYLLADGTLVSTFSIAQENEFLSVGIFYASSGLLNDVERSDLHIGQLRVEIREFSDYNDATLLPFDFTRDTT